MITPVEISLWVALVAALTIIGGVSGLYFSLKYLKNLIINRLVNDVTKTLDIEFLINQKLEAWDISQDIAEPLDDGLDRLVETLKIQIPMAAMFLSGPLVEKLKGIAKGEIIKMIPGIKKKLFLRIQKEVDCQLVIRNGVSTFINTHFFPLLRQQSIYWGAIVATVAFIFFGLLTWFLLQMIL